MKKEIIYMMACIIMFASCRKDVEQVLPETINVEFGASIGGGSRTYLDGTKVLWADGDQISVNGAALNITAGVGHEYGTFRGVVTPYNSNKYFVGYPVENTFYNAGTLSVNLPSTQTYNADKSLLGVMPMVSYVEGTGNKMTIYFQNVTSVLAFKLYGNNDDASKVKEIVVESSEAPLTGKVANIASDGTITPCTPTGTIGYSITLDCGEGVQLGTDADNATLLYVAIPMITTATTFTIQMYCANGRYQENTINVSESLFSATNKIYTTAPKAVNATIQNAPFSVSDTKKVIFSPGNLYYSSETWGFEANQYDFRTMYDGVGKPCCINGVYNDEGTDENNFGLFRYSTPSSNWGMDYDAVSVSGDFRDWGTITSLPQNGSGDFWRTLGCDESSGEWYYLLNTRSGKYNGSDATAEQLRAHAQITVSGGHVNGLILLPDDFTLPTGLSFSPDNEQSSYSYDNNIYTTDQWSQIESAGAVFLPAAGWRKDVMQSVNDDGHYRSYTRYSVRFSTDGVGVDADSDNPKYGNSVRLVHDIS